MPNLDKGVIATDTAINSDGYAPGIAQPTTVDEIRDLYTSTRPISERHAALQSLRKEMVSREAADVEGGYNHLIAEIDRGLGILKGNAEGSADPDVLRQADKAVNPENL